MNYSITQEGKTLDESKYTIDLDNKVFSSKENALVLDFSNCYGWCFNTGNHCTFNTDGNCIFNTEYNCTFNTDGNCIFNTGSNCTFNTGNHCTFNTGNKCTFKTDWKCTFNTGNNCIFECGECCTYMIRDINSQKFQKTDGISIILDTVNNARYVLDENLLGVIRISNG